jgi:MFS superfamily sulfate permease-like transporter
MAVVGQVPGTEHFRNVERHKVKPTSAILTLRVDESLYFANARYLEDKVYDMVAQRPQLKHVMLMCPAVNEIDMSALESLEAINERLKALRRHLPSERGQGAGDGPAARQRFPHPPDRQGVSSASIRRSANSPKSIIPDNIPTTERTSP